jgi:hypothetical protein
MSNFTDSYRTDLNNYDYCGNDDLWFDKVSCPDEDGRKAWIGFAQAEDGSDIEVPPQEATMLVWSEDIPFMGTGREERTLKPLHLQFV